MSRFDLAAAALFCVAAVAVFLAFRSPAFWASLVAIALKSLLPRLKGRKFTPEERARIKSGHSPFKVDR
jgi:hypothetical protein